VRIEVGRPFAAPPVAPTERVKAISNVVQTAYRAPPAVVNRMNAILAGSADPASK